MGRIILGDNQDVLPGLSTGGFALIYIDPPFNTGKRQRMNRIRAERDDSVGGLRGVRVPGRRGPWCS